jgi:putative endonuclease
MRGERHYWFHRMQSSVRQALYIGMTNNLHRRIFEHKMRRTEGFTDDYNATRLVYWESFDDVYKAIVREKQLKNCRRLAKERKLWLIARFNPEGTDPAADWYPGIGETQGPSTSG